MKIAVVGSGPAALMAVRTLCWHAQTMPNNSSSSLQVTWFTARRKMGATQQLNGGVTQTPKAGEPFFDYGCQYMCPISNLGKEEMKRWERLGLVQAVPVGVIDANSQTPKVLPEDGYVGVGGIGPMLDALIQQTVKEFPHVLKRISGHPQIQQQAVGMVKDTTKNQWYLSTQKMPRQYGPFDYVIGAFGHPKRTDPFLESGGQFTAALKDCLHGVRYNQFIACQVEIKPSSKETVLKNLGFVSAHVQNDSVLSFVTNNSRKPHRPLSPQNKIRQLSSNKSNSTGGQCWTLLSTAKFASGGKRKDSADKMVKAFARCMRIDMKDLHYKIHRINFWSDGLPVRTIRPDFLFDAKQNIGWCGDFCVAPCVDGAMQSGHAVAQYCLQACEMSGGSSSSSTVEDVLPSRNEWENFASNDDCIYVDIGKFGHSKATFMVPS